MKPPTKAARIIAHIMMARDSANKEISDMSRGGGIGAGLASEGYAGGYRDALDDVLLVLNGVTPQSRGYWEPEAEQRNG